MKSILALMRYLCVVCSIALAVSGASDKCRAEEIDLTEAVVVVRSGNIPEAEQTAAISSASAREPIPTTHGTNTSTSSTSAN